MVNEIRRIKKKVPIETIIGKYLDIERFLLCCKDCPNYGKKYTCPPHAFNVRDFWLGFSELEIWALVLEGNQNYEEAESLLMDELLQLEAQTPGSVCLSAGNAGISEKDRMRYSIESLGGNVDTICRDLLGITLEWGKKGELPANITLVAGLLRK